MNAAPSLSAAPVFVSTVWHDDLGVLKRPNIPLDDAEGLLRVLVSEPRAAVAKLGECPAETLDDLVRDLAAATDKKTRDAVKLRSPSWVPARFSGTSRRAAECVERQIIGHDFDGVEGSTFEAAAEAIVRQLPGRFLAIHTTATERNDDGTWRLRAYEILDRPATPAEWEARVKPHMRSLGEHDPNALDVSRLLFLPLRTAGYRWLVVEGPRTSLDRLEPKGPTLAKASAAATLAGPTTTPATTTDRAQQRRKAAATLLAAAWPSRGSRHGAQLALAGALRRDGWDQDAALEFLCDVCREAGDEDRPKREKTIEHTWSTTAHLTSWTRLEQYIDPVVVSAVRALLSPHADEFTSAMRELGGAANDSKAPKESDAFEGDDVDRAFDTLRAEGRKQTPRGRTLELPRVDWTAPVPEPTYLVRGLIPVETVGMFVAQGSSLKTWTMLDIARAIVKGAPWLGTFDTRKGRVLVVDFESGLYELRRRMHILEPGADHDGLVPLCYPDERIDDVEFWKALARAVRRDGIDVVAIDSLAAGAAGVDENDTTAALPLKCAAKLSDLTGATVLVIHHARKDDGDDRKMVRGSTAIYADCDWAYRFVDVSETGSARRMEMRCIKPCMGPKPAPVALELSDAGLRLLDGQQHDQAREAEIEKRRARIRKVLARGPQPNARAIERAANAKSGAFTDDVRDMVDLREIVRIPGRGLCLDSPVARLERLRAALEGEGGARLSTLGALASAAHVDTDVVREALRDGHIVRSGEGRFMWITDIPSRSVSPCPPLRDP